MLALTRLVIWLVLTRLVTWSAFVLLIILVVLALLVILTVLIPFTANPNHIIFMERRRKRYYLVCFLFGLSRKVCWPIRAREGIITESASDLYVSTRLS